MPFIQMYTWCRLFRCKRDAVYSDVHMMPIPVAAWSEMYVRGRSIAGIASSKRAEGVF
jgi:hypothetical protein